MAVGTTKVNIPTKWSTDRVTINTMQLVEDWTKRPRCVAVDDLTQSISNPPTQAEVQAIQNKINELLASLRTDNSNILDTNP